MIRSFFKYLCITAIIGFIAYSCVKKKTYPTVPEIEFKAFYPYAGDSADLQIKFTDGDGDIGVSSTDSTQSLYVTYYYKDTITKNYVGFYSPLFNDTLRTGYVVRSPKDSYAGKPISGDISVRLQQYRHSNKIKSVKYVVYLIDKHGNKSLPLTTPVQEVQ